MRPAADKCGLIATRDMNILKGRLMVLGKPWLAANRYNAERTTQKQIPKKTDSSSSSSSPSPASVPLPLAEEEEEEASSSSSSSSAAAATTGDDEGDQERKEKKKRGEEREDTEMTMTTDELWLQHHMVTGWTGNGPDDLAKLQNSDKSVELIVENADVILKSSGQELRLQGVDIDGAPFEIAKRSPEVEEEEEEEEEEEQPEEAEAEEEEEEEEEEEGVSGDGMTKITKIFFFPKEWRNDGWKGYWVHLAGFQMSGYGGGGMCIFDTDRETCLMQYAVPYWGQEGLSDDDAYFGAAMLLLTRVSSY